MKDFLIDVISTSAVAITAVLSLIYILNHNANDNPVISIFALASWIISGTILLLMWTVSKFYKDDDSNEVDK
ncbi:hypothetical protein [Alloscardovia omnicolens]